MLRTFPTTSAGCRPTGPWPRSSRPRWSAVRAQVGNGRVICGLSGGVDSAVAAALIHEAIGDQLTCVFVDTGLLRLGEAEQVVDTFREQFNIDLVHVEAADRFLGGLDGVTDPERKRKIIGRDVHRRLRRGGRRPRRRPVPGAGHALSRRDRERRRTDGPAATIKSHHNVGGLPEDMNFELVEPLARPVQGRGPRPSASSSACPRTSSAATRSPAPASPSASSATSPRNGWRSCARPTPSHLEEIRMPGCTRALAGLRRAAAGPHRRRDGRRPHLRLRLALRAVTSDDGMTADWARCPTRPARAAVDADHQRGAGRQPRGLRRDLKPPGTIEWE